MSACERCWRDAANADDPAARYRELLAERTGARACTPEEQAGTAAGWCETCQRRTRHQHTEECMNGCRA